MGKQTAAMFEYTHPRHGKNRFQFQDQIQHGYKDCKHPLEYFHNLCKCPWFDKEESTIYMNNVGIKDETIDCSHRDSEVADNQEQY